MKRADHATGLWLTIPQELEFIIDKPATAPKAAAYVRPIPLELAHANTAPAHHSPKSPKP